jgi:hypothetical protein
MLRIFISMSLVLLFSYSNFASDGYGPICSERNDDGKEFCTPKIEQSILSMTQKDVKTKVSKMSYYARGFEGHETKSGNCFVHRDPTLAVNQGQESDIGKIVLLQKEGSPAYYALVTDTGVMGKKQKGRDLDSTRTLFDSLGEIKDGVQKVRWGKIGSVDDLIDGEIDPKVDFELVIACIKRLNKRATEASEQLKAEKLEAEAKAKADAKAKKLAEKKVKEDALIRMAEVKEAAEKARHQALVRQTAAKKRAKSEKLTKLYQNSRNSRNQADNNGR